MTTYKTLGQEIYETLQEVENNPKNPKFYIHAAKLYSCQGKQQEAISILKQGISISSANTTRNDDTLLLQQNLTIVTQRWERRIDFIIQSPYEIVFTIVTHLANDQEASITCLDVCHAWRCKFLEHGKVMWRSMDLHGTPPKKKQLKVLPMISKYIKSLSMYPGPRPGTVLPGLLDTYDFSNVRTLSITYRKEPSGKDYDHVKYIMDSLFRIGKQLTGLDICVGKASAQFALQKVLHETPHINSLKISVYGSLGWQLLRVPDLSSLTRLELIARRKRIPLTMIDLIFDHAPHLQHLILYKFYSETNIMSVLGDRCPKLVEIRATLTEPDSTEEMQHRKSRPVISKDEQSEPGLQCLELRTPNMNSAIPLVTRLKKSCHTLKKLSLVPTPTNKATPTLTDWKPLSLYTMYNLTVFTVSFPCLSFFMHMPAILPRFPALESLHIEYPNSSRRFPTSYDYIKNDEVTNNGIFDAIAQLEKLTKLHISYATVNGPGFKRMLLKLMAQENYKRMDTKNNNKCNQQHSIGDGLRNFELYRCNGLDMISLLTDIAMIRSLQSFTLDGSSSTIHDEIKIKQFQETIKMMTTTLPELSSLNLDAVPITLDTVQSMTDCKSLRALTLGKSVQYQECTKNNVRKLVNQQFKGMKNIC